MSPGISQILVKDSTRQQRIWIPNINPCGAPLKCIRINEQVHESRFQKGMLDLAMRLLNTKTLELESFFDDEIPAYTILSHTWDKDEILYDDIKHGCQHIPTTKKGFTKVHGSCELLLKWRRNYIWIDTCCIDKSSSTELSEAINSMFKWYENSRECIVYLADVAIGDKESFSKSRWFTRGWTLQELIAPEYVEFFDKNWNCIGTRQAMAFELSKITGIPLGLLARSYEFLYLKDHLATFSVAAKMSWASKRQTTRIEDRAYCLLGMFNVNMPLVYGEGMKAFTRLQMEIIRTTNDQSILAHEGISPGLAVDPKDFIRSHDVQLATSDFDDHLGIACTDRGLEITTLLCPAHVRVSNAPAAASTLDVDRPNWGSCGLALLNCSIAGDYLSRPGIVFLRKGEDQQRVRRRWPFRVFRIQPGSEAAEMLDSDHKYVFEVAYDVQSPKVEKVFIETDKAFSSSHSMPAFAPPLCVKQLGSKRYRIKQISPKISGESVLPCAVYDGKDFHWCWGGLWMTNDSTDEFFIIWGLIEPQEPRLWYEYYYGWWKDYQPWCYVLEWPRIQEYKPPTEDVADWIDHSWELLKNFILPPTNNATCERPTGCKISIEIKAVDFLGRRGFQLTTDETTS